VAKKSCNHFATNRTAEWPLQKLSRARAMRPLVAGLVAQRVFGGHFEAIPLGFSAGTLAPLGTLLGPKPKGQCSMETLGLSPEIRLGPEGHFEQSAPTPDAEPNELSCSLSGCAERMRGDLHPSGPAAFGSDSSQTQIRRFESAFDFIDKF
jgi:hypothetical protein